MLANANIISCNFSSFTSSTLNDPKLRTSLQSQNLKPRISFLKPTLKFSAFLKPHNHTSSILEFQRKGLVQICHGNLTNQNSEDPAVEKGDSLEGGVGGSGNGGEGWNWSTSILLLVLWGALMYYIFNLAPNQTPVLLKKKNWLYIYILSISLLMHMWFIPISLLRMHCQLQSFGTMAFSYFAWCWWPRF